MSCDRPSPSLEMESDLSSEGSGSYIVRSAERRQKVIQGLLVGDVYGCELQAPLVPVPTEQVVIAHGEIEQVTGRDAWWILIIVLGPWRRDGNERRSILRGITCGQGIC